MNLKTIMKGGTAPAPKPEKEGIDQECINKGLAEETKEHPWLGPKNVRRLVMDHLSMDDDYYESED